MVRSALESTMSSFDSTPLVEGEQRDSALVVEEILDAGSIMENSIRKNVATGASVDNMSSGDRPMIESSMIQGDGLAAPDPTPTISKTGDEIIDAQASSLTVSAQPSAEISLRPTVSPINPEGRTIDERALLLVNEGQGRGSVSLSPRSLSQNGKLNLRCKISWVSSGSNNSAIPTVTNQQESHVKLGRRNPEIPEFLLPHILKILDVLHQAQEPACPSQSSFLAADGDGRPQSTVKRQRAHDNDAISNSSAIVRKLQSEPQRLETLLINLRLLCEIPSMPPASTRCLSVLLSRYVH